MKRVLRDERGMALAVAIFALVVVGAMVAGAFFAGNQEQRVGENSRRLGQSFGVAEGALNEIMQGWNPKVYNRIGQYPTDSLIFSNVAVGGGSGTYSGTIRRLNDQIYFVDMVGTDKASASGKVYGGGARQRLGMLFRIRLVDMKIGAALTTRGSVKLAGNAQVSGKDVIPEGWNTNYCDTIGDTTKAGIRAPDSVYTETGGGTHLDGNPPFSKDTSVHLSTFTQFGDISYANLAASANITIPGGNYKTNPSLIGAACNTADQLNWGDGMNPSQPCGTWFPIIHVTGDITLNGDQGQGILLVDGDMHVQGSYQFFGIVLVQGSLSTAGGGSTDAHFYGAVMAENVDLELNSLSGNATLQYSKCAVTNAMEMTQTVTPVRQRSWSQLF